MIRRLSIACLLLCLAVPVGPGFAMAEGGCDGQHSSLHDSDAGHDMPCCDSACDDDSLCGSDCRMGHPSPGWALSLDLPILFYAHPQDPGPSLDCALCDGVSSLPLRPPITA